MNITVLCLLNYSMLYNTILCYSLYYTLIYSILCYIILYYTIGCGKTFLMDLFYECVPIVRKKRVHFHDFMIDVHKRIHIARMNMIHEQELQQDNNDHTYSHGRHHLSPSSLSSSSSSSSSSSRINQAIDRARNHQSSISSITSSISSSLSSSSFFMNHQHNQQHNSHHPLSDHHHSSNHHSNSVKKNGNNEIMKQIASDILNESYLICFDEFQVRKCSFSCINFHYHPYHHHHHHHHHDSYYSTHSHHNDC